eukprot:TRINITY_DN350_c0_g1_i2.p1 TRINITY_DN350_c0_g1~~TRINITY_DN350_c0_g1_i2.p1  ORF type:complete len:454 (-),score=71.13 TRINITY_DN350_c0_g1_i2:224-1585(-)
MVMVRGLALFTSCLAFASAYVTPLIAMPPARPVPPVAMPAARPVPPLWSTQASAAAIASSAAVSASRPTHASRAHPGVALRGRIPMRAVPMDASEVEAELIKIFSDTNATAARLYSEADLLRLPSLANGEPSVKYLLTQLEVTKPPPAIFNKNELVGEWQLVYTNDLPLAVRDEVLRHGKHIVSLMVQDLSVVLSISDKGAMSKTSFVTWLGEEKTVFNEESSMVQIDSSPSFTVTGPHGESASAHVTYSGNDLLVMRKEDSTDEWISQAFESLGVSPPVPNVEVWKRLNGHAVETPSAASPISFWRFGLPALALDTTTGDTNIVSRPSSLTVEPSRNPSLVTCASVAAFPVSVMFLSMLFHVFRSLSQIPAQPRVASTELASYGESNSAYSPSMEVLDAAARGAIGGPHHGPSSTDRMLENQQRQDERQIDKQATEIEALKKELDQLKAEKK